MIGLSLLLAALVGASPAASTTPAIHFTGETTDGKTLTLPDDAQGKDLILIVSFTQDGAKRAQSWSDALAVHAMARTSIVNVAVLDRVPGFIRGLVRKAISKDVGPPQTGKPGFVTTTDGGSLRAAAPSGDRDDPVIYVFGPRGALVETRRAPYSEDNEKEIVSALP